ncbi:MAG: hypothetical protein QF593_07640, partial [Nitrospinota bacterium]|nr:hypothetical protein [Nitrospinota bacterium]
MARSIPSGHPAGFHSDPERRTPFPWSSGSGGRDPDESSVAAQNMTLRQKTLLIIGAVLVVLIGAL